MDDYVNRMDEILGKLNALREELADEDLEDGCECPEPEEDWQCIDYANKLAEDELKHFGLTMHRNYSLAETQAIRQAVQQILSPLLG